MNPMQDTLAPAGLASEAARAVAFIDARNLADSNFVIATPQKFNEAGFNQNQYCAWHDYTTPAGYPGLQQGIAFTNMPYVLNAGGGCGMDFVNPAPAGNLDGVTLVLGPEIAETLTDPGAESSTGLVHNGAWFDYQGWEIGDKCAWGRHGLPIPVSPFNMPR